MTLQDQLREHLQQTGVSMRALSLNAGLNPKAVSDIQRLKGLKPKRATLKALEEATGLELVGLAVEQGQTYAGLIARLMETPKTNPAFRKSHRRAGRLRWLMRHAGWVAETRTVCRHEVIAFFERINPATVDLSEGSFSTYKSEILGIIDGETARQRKRGIADIDGLYRDVHDLVGKSDLPLYQKNGSGSFFVFLHDNGFKPADITTDVLQRYYEHRIGHSVKNEVRAKRQTKEVSNLLEKLARHPDFEEFGFVPVSHPFTDGRDRYGVADEQITDLMREFDDKVAPWALGKTSRAGESMQTFLETLDAQNKPLEGKKALLRKSERKARNKSERRVRADDLLRLGFLPANKRWSQSTLRNRRGYVVAAAKALMSARGYLIGSIDELTDPDVIENIADVLAEANEDREFASDYVPSVLKTLRKLAVGYCEREAQDIEDISELIKDYEMGRRGIAPRNKAKLQAFTPERIQRFIDVSDEIIRDVNARAEGVKHRFRRKHGKTPDLSDIYDPEMLRDVMMALAQDILLVRAPRSENLIGIELDWIRWTGEQATIVVPAPRVKMRTQADADLVIPLNPFVSKRLKLFIEKLRPLALAKGDMKNPYLFPGQGARNAMLGAPYKGLLKRLCRKVTELTGIRVNPHLYRHLLGWIWLREDPGKLPAVQKLLGHKSLQTTLDYYAEVDEALALDQWQEHIDEKRRNPNWAA